MIDVKTIITFLIGSSIMFGLTRLFSHRDSRTAAEIQERDDNRNRVNELERKLAVLSAEAVPINAMIQAIAIAKLTHMHEPATDKLLVKGANDVLTREDADELEAALAERILVVDSEVDEEERIYAKILPDIIRLRQIEEEKAAAGEQTPTVVVKVIAPVLEPK